jgi:hypothetical protein
VRRKEAEPLKKHLVSLYEGDFEELQSLHGRLGASKVIRILVRAHLKRAKEKAAQAAKPVEIDASKIELEIDNV